jgi:MHS family proline/betaine transporter-like MFS transporter
MSKMKKVITSTMLGNGLEWYDYALYGTFSALISQQFFPKGDAVAALIATFGIFAAGFLMRPLGAMFFTSAINLGAKMRWHSLFC